MPPVTIDGTNGITTPMYSGAISANAVTPSVNMKSRIINGAMVIDQRNNGAAISTDNAAIFTVDRFFFIEDAATTSTTQQVADAPAGFSYSFKFTNSATTATPSYAQLVQRIEGYNVADLGFGTATAQTITLSFWVKSSLTGQFSASLRNSASNRSNVSTYTISSANTWEYKTITFVGDTTGTWLTTNGNGLELIYRIAGSGGTSTLNQWTATGDAFASGNVNVMGTASATWQITGVQLEKGSNATSFDYRPYGTELALCQRYFVELYGGTNAYQPLGLGNTYSTTMGSYCIYLPVPMRAVPSLTTSGAIYFQNLGNINISSFAGPYSQCGTIVEGDFTMASAVTTNTTSFMRFNNVNTSTSRFNYSAEL